MIRRILVAIWVSVWVLSFASCAERAASRAVPDGVVPVYNVKDYGVKGDGVTDDAPAIQALLDSVMEWGGGTVYFPNGRYRLVAIHEAYGVKAHLILRPRTLTPGKRDYGMIRIEGEGCAVTPCAYANHTGTDTSEVWDNGTILFSDVLGEVQTDPSVCPVSVFAVGAGANGYGLNQAVVRLQDIAFQAKSEPVGYPRLSGVNVAYAATVYTVNVLIFSSTRSTELTSPSADGHYSAGFIGPRLWCNPEQEFRNLYVKSAFRYGFIFSEHANGNNLSAWNCDQAFVFSRMDHSSWFGRIHAQNCSNILTSLEVPFAGHVPGASFVKVEQVGIEVNTGQVPIDFNYQNFVVDPDNMVHGSVSYHIVRSNVGADNSCFKAVGAANLKAEASF